MIDYPETYVLCPAPEFPRLPISVCNFDPATTAFRSVPFPEAPARVLNDFERVWTSPSNPKMPFTPERDADAEGPVAWPGSQSPVEEFRNPLDHPVDPAEAVRNLKRKNSGEKHMTLKDFINISISMAGAQIAWTLELG